MKTPHLTSEGFKYCKYIFIKKMNVLLYIHFIVLKYKCPCPAVTCHICDKL